MMKIYIKLTILALLPFLFGIGNVYANDDEKFEIERYNYTKNFDKYNELDFTGKQFDTCKTITLDGKNVPFEIKSPYNLKIKYSDLGKINGNLNFKCDGKNIIYSYGIPYIEKVEFSKSNPRRLTIYGKNFSYRPTLKTNGMANTLISGDDSTIVIELGKDGYFEEIYVTTVGGMKSNIVKSPVKLPQIDYVKSENGFYAGDYIKICGKNFTSSDDIFLASKEYFSSEKELIGSCFNIKLSSDIIGNSYIQIKNEHFSSNTVSIDIKGVRPKIESVLQRSVVNRENVGVPGLILYGKDFGDNISQTRAYVNGKSVEIFSIKDTEIHLEAGEYQDGENYIYIDKNGSISEVYGLIKKEKVPTITEIKDYDVDKESRYFDVIMNLGFNEETDNIRLNGSKLKLLRCYKSNCKVKMPVNTLKGTLAVYRYDEKISPDFNFNIQKRLMPLLEKVEIIGKLKSKSNVKVTGQNLYGVTVSADNLFYTTPEGRLEYKVNGQTIEGLLPVDFDANKTSSINLSSYGYSTSQSFDLKERKDGVIFFPPVLTDIEGESLDLNPGSLVKISGAGLKKSDLIYFGQNKTYPKSVSEDGTILTTIIPKNLVGGQTSVYIENEFGLKSQPLSFIMEDSGVVPRIKFFTKSNKSKETIYTNKVSYNYDIITLGINNKITDAYVDNIEFKISGSNKKNLGTFSLYLDNKKLFTKKVNSEGRVVFKNFTIPKYYSDKTLVLKKESPFLETGKFEAKVVNSSLKVKQVNTFKDLDIIDTSNLNPSSFNVVFFEETSCVDTLSDKSNCNKLDIIDNNVDNSDNEPKQPKKEEEKVVKEDKAEKEEIKNVPEKVKPKEKTVNEKASLVVSSVNKYVAKKAKGNKLKKLKIYDGLLAYLRTYLQKDISNQQKVLLKRVYIKLKIERTKAAK